MKYIFSFLSLLAVLFLHFGCKEDDYPVAPIDQLPPLTTTGENTFGYLVNGEAIVVSNSLKITAIFQQGLLQLGGGVQNKNIDIDITIVLQDPLTENMPYDLTNFPIYRSRYKDFNTLEECDYSYEDTFEGSISFTKIDRTNFIISGLFEFSTVTQNCDTIRITDGRFDVQYIP